MSFSDDNGSMVLDIMNIIFTLGIMGVLFYVYLSYMDMQTRIKDRLAQYEKNKPATAS